ncbi:hypothetical protein CF326_g4833 [Tilletia indica]|nr:hypothetical protein CF326_g4833 [Tilletia indica]
MDIDFKTFVAYDWDSIKTTEDLLATRVRRLKRRTDDLDKARVRLQHARAQGRRYADEKEAHQLRDPWKPNDLVIAWNPTHANKAQDRWMGPYRVVRQREGGTYYLK